MAVFAVTHSELPLVINAPNIIARVALRKGLCIGRNLHTLFTLPDQFILFQPTLSRAGTWIYLLRTVLSQPGYNLGFLSYWVGRTLTSQYHPRESGDPQLDIRVVFNLDSASAGMTK
jgi:hypothetical protein